MSQSPDLLPMARAGQSRAIINLIKQELQKKRLNAEVSFADEILTLQLDIAQAQAEKDVVAQIYTLLQSLKIPRIRQVKVSALRGIVVIWSRELKLGSNPGQTFDRIPFDDLRINLTAFPIAFVLALTINNIGILALIHLPLHIWIHEFGHATVAWLTGHRALPLPIGWTTIMPERSLFVYFGILFLLGLLFWTGRKERILWPQILAVGIALLQFYMTWILPPILGEMLFSFGGIGGEFYLSTFLIVCFYFRLPDRWRWDFWRFGVLVIAFSTLWKSFWQWHHIQLGLAKIPFGTIFGGQGDAGGDMNRLVSDFGWSPDRIIRTYSGLGTLCMLVVLATYALFLLKLNPQIWFGIRQRLLLLTGRDR